MILLTYVYHNAWFKECSHWNVSNYLPNGSIWLLHSENEGTTILHNACINLQVDTTARTEKTQIFRTDNIYKILLAGFARQTGRKLTLFAVSSCFYPSSFADDFPPVDSIIVTEEGVQVLHCIKCTIFNTINTTFISYILSKSHYSGNMFWPILVIFRHSSSDKVKIRNCIQCVE